MWVEVATKREGTILVDPYKQLYTNVMNSPKIGITNLEWTNHYKFWLPISPITPLIYYRTKW